VKICDSDLKHTFHSESRRKVLRSEEAVVDVSGNNLEWIIQYCRTVFNTLSVPDFSLYPSITSGQIFHFEKENEKCF